MKLFSLTMISCAFVVSVRNLATLAASGWHMIFFIAVAAIFFFMPVALVSAELATGWPENGGIYVWVKQAFGDRLGFVSVWLQWTYMIIAVMTMLYFLAGSLAYVFHLHPQQSRWQMAITLLVVLWLFTLLNLYGQKISTFISSFCFMIGVAIPAVFMLVLGLLTLLQPQTMHLGHLSLSVLLPNFSHLSNWVLLVGFMLTLSGIEASASHANEVDRPQRNYPLAILVVAAVGIAINLLGGLAVANAVPMQQLSLSGGLMEAFSSMLAHFHLTWLTPVLALLVSLGVAGGISTWLMGPVKGLLATAQYGDLPPYLQKQNKYTAPQNLLLIQAVVISVIGCSLLLLPSLNIAYWLTVALAMIVYCVMYALMLAAAIRLRYSQATVERAYRVPGGNIGIWLVAGMGILIMLFVIVAALIPPTELATAHKKLYIGTQAVAAIVALALPFYIYHRRQPEWKKAAILFNKGETSQ